MRAVRTRPRSKAVGPRGRERTGDEQRGQQVDRVDGKNGGGHDRGESEFGLNYRVEGGGALAPAIMAVVAASTKGNPLRPRGLASAAGMSFGTGGFGAATRRFDLFGTISKDYYIWRNGSTIIEL